VRVGALRSAVAIGRPSGFSGNGFLTPFFLHTALDFPCLMFLLPGRTICRVKGKILA